MDIYWVSPFLLLFLIGIYYRRYLGWIILWVQFNYKRAQLIWTMINNFKDPRDQPAPTCVIIDNGMTDTSAIVTYSKMSQPYQILVPYHRDHVVAMSQFTTELIMSDGSSQSITQEPGIPYLVSAKQLGGEIIRITNGENASTYDYLEDTIPGYGNEVMWTE